ncbi:MAG TPA: biopolymer transporter ExbD [Bryobacteraceae bacterium]|nr:biopolymer transporter ExbD [Bryobacteraceae bacterium]
MTLGGQGPVRASINMTPMIDVLLVLIIIFMVITPVAPRGLETLVPQPSSALADRSAGEALVVTVREDGTMLLNREMLTAPELESRLTEIFRAAPSRAIFVGGEGDLEFSRVARAIDLIHGVGISRVALMMK